MQPKIDIDSAAMDAAKLLKLEARATKGPWTAWQNHPEVYANVKEQKNWTIRGQKLFELDIESYFDANSLPTDAMDLDGECEEHCDDCEYKGQCKAWVDRELITTMRNSIADLARAVIVLREALSEIKLVHMVDTQEFIHEATRRLFGDAEGGNSNETNCIP